MYECTDVCQFWSLSVSCVCHASVRVVQVGLLRTWSGKCATPDLMVNGCCFTSVITASSIQMDKQDVAGAV